VVVVASADGADPARSGFSAHHWASTHGGLAGLRGGEVLLMLPGTRPGSVARCIARELGTALGVPVTAGASGPTTGLQGIPLAYREAARCLEALVALDRTGDGASPADLGFLGLLLGGTRDVPGFLTAVIGPVVDYDRRRGTALVRTLEAYFGNGGSLAPTAQALHVHVNTVTQRLERVGQLLGEGWQQPDSALEVQLALRLYRLGGDLSLRVSP